MNKKKSAKRYLLWGLLAVLTLGLAVMPLMARQQQTNDGPTASILSADAKVGSVQAAIHGGGTLEAGDPEDIEIPKDVKITEFLVKNGDMVEEGDALATVDKVSVMTAITEIRDSMSTVRKQMETYSSEQAATEVSATAGGRVKLVYAQEGDRVESVMLEHGALAVLSLDSKMCVKLTADSGLLTGDTVPVTLADGTVVDGRVESNLDGELAVTIEDKGYTVGQTVTVENVGTGELEIHSPWPATAFTGTVSIVYAQPEQTLGSGAALFTLKDTDYTAQREILAQTHREYEELLQKLFQMYETGVISAPCNGMVSGIDTDSAHLLAAEEGELEVSLLSAQEDTWQITLLADFVPLSEGCTNNDSCTLDPKSPDHTAGCPKAECVNADKEGVCKAKTHNASCIEACTKQENCPAETHKNGCPEKCTNDLNCKVSDPTKHEDTCPRKCTNDANCQATHHLDSCICLCIHADAGGAECPAKNHYNDCIKSCKNSQSENDFCPATKHLDTCYYYGVTSYKAIAAKVYAVGEKLIVFYDASGEKDVVKTASGWALADGSTISETTMIKQGEISEGVGMGFAPGDIILIVKGYKSDGSTVNVGPVLYRKGQASIQVPSFTMPSMSFSFSMPSLGGSYGTTTQTQLYDLNGDVLMTVTPQDTMTLTVAVDESDISSVKTGMSAEITVNALPGETFEGEITKTAMTGSSSGGSSKFDVEITLPRESKMLAGMSASAVITLYEKMDVLTLPVAALSEDGSGTIVYTALDKKTGEPAGPVEVTTGISDGETVEILSGLTSGQRVYYAYYDTLEESDAVESNRLTMMG